MPDQTSLADLADTLPETLRAQVLSQLGGSGTEAPWTRYQGAAAPSEASGASDVEDGPWSQYAHTDDLDVPVADTNSGVWATALEAGRRGLRESLTDTTHAVDPFTDRAAEAYDANDHVSKLLAEPVSQVRRPWRLWIVRRRPHIDCVRSSERPSHVQW